MTRRGESGFTLIETIIGLTIMMLMITAVVGLFVDNLHVLTIGKARAIGLQLANEQMEYLRDLPYQSAATVGGAIYPPGTIADTQTMIRGGYTFWVQTEISYVDDPYDGNAAGTIVGKPTDLNSGDYKKAQVTVRMRNATGTKVAQLTTDIAGKAAETASNTGVISVKVIDANGQPVANASVHIYNPSPNPDVDITTTTDNQGSVVIPNLPPDSSNRYQITASLSGYSTDGTIADPAGAQTAVEQNLNVLAQQISAITLSIDRIATLNLSVVDTSGAALAGKAITVTGAKKIKQNPDEYKYSASSTTDSSGSISLSAMEWDSYSFVSPAGYYLVSVQPYAPVALQPGTSLSVKLILSTLSSFPAISSVTPTSAPSTPAMPSNGRNTATNLGSYGESARTRSGCSCGMPASERPVR